MDYDPAILTSVLNLLLEQAPDANIKTQISQVVNDLLKVAQAEYTQQQPKTAPMVARINHLKQTLMSKLTQNDPVQPNLHYLNQLSKDAALGFPIFLAAIRESMTVENTLEVFKDNLNEDTLKKVQMKRPALTIQETIVLSDEDLLQDEIKKQKLKNDADELNSNMTISFNQEIKYLNNLLEDFKEEKNEESCHSVIVGAKKALENIQLISIGHAPNLDQIKSNFTCLLSNAYYELAKYFNDQDKLKPASECALASLNTLAGVKDLDSGDYTRAVYSYIILSDIELMEKKYSHAWAEMCKAIDYMTLMSQQRNIKIELMQEVFDRVLRSFKSLIIDNIQESVISNDIIIEWTYKLFNIANEVNLNYKKEANLPAEMNTKEVSTEEENDTLLPYYLFSLILNQRLYAIKADQLKLPANSFPLQDIDTTRLLVMLNINAQTLKILQNVSAANYLIQSDEPLKAISELKMTRGLIRDFVKTNGINVSYDNLNIILAKLIAEQYYKLPLSDETARKNFVTAYKLLKQIKTDEKEILDLKQTITQQYQDRKDYQKILHPPQANLSATSFFSADKKDNRPPGPFRGKRFDR